MVRTGTFWRAALGRFVRDTSGAPTLEFAVILPFLVIIIFMFAEVGVFAGRTILLKRGVNVAIRDVQIAADPLAGIDQFKQTVCRNAFLITNCSQNLMVEMRPITQIGSPSFGAAGCVNRVDPDLSPVVEFTQGSPNEIMFVRACLSVDPVFPSTGLGVGLQWDSSGGYYIVASTAFMNEPS